MAVDAKEFYKLIIDKNGNPSIGDLKRLGYSEGKAVEVVTRMANKDSKSLVSSAKNLLKQLGEPIEEANYGGAFDVEENQFFTRDDLNEFMDVINEKCPKGLEATEIYMGNDGKTLEVVFNWDEYGEESVYKKIDMRAIRKPSDLFKYANELIQMGADKVGYIDEDELQYQDAFTDFYRPRYESVEESIETEYGPYWYYTRHGVGPGSIPNDINILKVAYDEENDPWGEYFLSDKLIVTDDLRRYEIKEKKPPKGAIDSKGEIVITEDAEFVSKKNEYGRELLADLFELGREIDPYDFPYDDIEEFINDHPFSPKDDIEQVEKIKKDLSYDAETSEWNKELIKLCDSIIERLKKLPANESLKESRGHTRTFSVTWDYKSGNTDSEIFGNEDDARDFVFDELKEIAESDGEELDHIEIKFSEQYGGMVADEDVIFEWDSEDGELKESTETDFIEDTEKCKKVERFLSRIDIEDYGYKLVRERTSDGVVEVEFPDTDSEDVDIEKIKRNAKEILGVDVDTERDGEFLTFYFKLDESLKEGGSRIIYNVEPRQAKSGLWEIVMVDTGNLAHTKRFYNKEDAEKFIRRNARYNNWFIMSKKDFRKELETKEPTEFGKILSKQLDED